MAKFRVGRFAVAGMIAVWGLTSYAHTGDGALLDHVFEAYQQQRSASGARSITGSAEAARQMGDLLPLVKAEDGRTVLPSAAVCDSVDINSGVLVARFTLPQDFVPSQEFEMAHETAGAIFAQYFLETEQLTEVKVLGRLGSGEYVDLEQLMAMQPGARARSVEWSDDSWKLDGPITPGPDYSKEKPFDEAISEATARNVGGQGPVGTSSQPQGFLSGRTVYYTSGHGWTWTGTSWGLQRPRLLDMNEDHGNKDQTDFFAYYLFNAGATVVPMRPIGYQPNQVIVDNPAASFSGVWTDSTATYYYGSGTPYRSSAKSVTESATATYTPNIPAAGFYPVYCWAVAGSNRVPDQLYKVVHTGGTSEIRINHRRVGGGWIWLGSYYFDAGSNTAKGSVVISNQTNSASGSVIIADAIRFGNGSGSSTYLRETEAGRYWIESSVGTGGPTSVYNYASSDSSETIGSPARQAANMRFNDGQGYFGDVFLGWHSNATTGNPATATARGSVSLINNGSSSGTPTNQSQFATLVSDQIDTDCLIEDAAWDHLWINRASATLAGGYGEISDENLGYPVNRDSTNIAEMCGTLIEVAFHDNTEDTNLLRDPRVRNVVGRAAYKSIVKFFKTYNDTGAPQVFLPEPPVRIKVVNNGTGGVNISWQPGPSNGASGNAATGYRVYISTNGYGFGLATTTAGNSAVVPGLTAGQVYYFRVAGTNTGGESMPSEVLGARIVPSGAAPVLVVNGYDRIDRFNNVRETVPVMNNMDRLRLRQNNSFDYIVQHGIALAAANRYFDSCSNEAVISSDVTLGSYSSLVWILGEESTADETLNSTERTAVQNYLNAGGNLFISGSEVGKHLAGDGASPTFFNNFLRASYAADAAGSYQATGAAGTTLAGLVMNFGPNTNMYDVAAPDRIGVANGSTVAANYTNGGSGVAAVQYSGTYKLLYLAFPFEAINSESTRNQVMTNAMTFLSGSAVEDWSLF